MKKILFATTALVATASVAAADVTFSGYGRFGVMYSGATDAVAAGATAAADANAVVKAQAAVNAAETTAKLATAQAALTAAETAAAASAAVAAGKSSTDVTSRFHFRITATAESDAGVTFGGQVRIQQNEGSKGQTNAARFFAKSGGLEVGAGNINGALEFMPGQYPIDLGLTGLGYEYVAYGFNGDAYSSGGLGSSGSNGVEVMYSAGDLSLHVSASDTNDRVAAVAAYSMSGWTVALGGQDSDDTGDTEFTATVGGTIGPVSVGLAYADNGTNGDKTVLSGSFAAGAATNIEAYYADDSLEADASYGVDFNHSLGGGTSLRGGVASKHSGQTVADFGVRFNF